MTLGFRSSQMDFILGKCVHSWRRDNGKGTGFFGCLLYVRSCAKAHTDHRTKLDKSLKNRHYCYSTTITTTTITILVYIIQMKKLKVRVRWCVQGGSANKHRAEPGFPRPHTFRNILQHFFHAFTYQIPHHKNVWPDCVWLSPLDKWGNCA